MWALEVPGGNGNGLLAHMGVVVAFSSCVLPYSLPVQEKWQNKRLQSQAGTQLNHIVLCLSISLV
jgi:hypothetical protein